MPFVTGIAFVFENVLNMWSPNEELKLVPVFHAFVILLALDPAL